MYAAERRAVLAQRLSTEGRVSVLDAAVEFGVSGETVRRDLAVLEKNGLARRVHGGAVARGTVQAIELGVRERERQQSPAKARIAAAALDLLPAPGASITIDAGTSTAAFAAALPAERHHVAFTHAIPNAALLATHDAIDLHLIGGHVRGTTGAAVGAATVAAYESIRVDVAFLGTNGLTIDRGLTTPDADEAAVKTAVVRSAQQVVVLADSTKLSRTFVFAFAPLDALDVVVTDEAADPRLVAELRAADIDVVIA